MAAQTHMIIVLAAHDNDVSGDNGALPIPELVQGRDYRQRVSLAADMVTLNTEMHRLMVEQPFTTAAFANADFSSALLMDYLQRGVEIVLRHADVHLVVIDDQLMAKFVPFWDAVFNFCQRKLRFLVEMPALSSTPDDGPADSTDSVNYFGHVGNQQDDGNAQRKKNGGASLVQENLQCVEPADDVKKMELTALLNEANQHASELARINFNLHAQLREENAFKERLWSSASWKLSFPLRLIENNTIRVVRLFRALPGMLSASGGVKNGVNKLIAIIRRDGWPGVRFKIKQYYSKQSRVRQVSQNEKAQDRQVDLARDFAYYEEQHDYQDAANASDIRVLSYYLPQFHPTPENDAWHGEGFTEWTKVRSAGPLFEGHYQQHIPHEDIGYYILDTPDVLRRQAGMMKKAGVHGQVFYHYWFSGRLILSSPAQMLLANPDIDMPFCFCWANENWTRRWDGNESEVLLAQQYSKEDARDFIRYLIPFFQDSRYIKVCGRPMLQIYRAAQIPELHDTIKIWNHACREAGLAPPFLVTVLTRGATDPSEFGMDAGVERVLHDWTNGAVDAINDSLILNAPIKHGVLPYDQVAAHYMNQTEIKGYTRFRSVVPIWDNTARYGTEAYVVHGSTPLCFQKWLESVFRWTRTALPAECRFVMINAWNEWAEGAHLEPDQRYGYSYLNSIGRALAGIPYSQEVDRVALPKRRQRLHVQLDPLLMRSFDLDPYLRKRFLCSLTRSSIIKSCAITINSPEIAGEYPVFNYAESCATDFVLCITKPNYFDESVLEKMLDMATLTGAAVIPNFYGGEGENGDRGDVAPVLENGAVTATAATYAPMVMVPAKLFGKQLRAVRMCSTAHCFVTYPSLRLESNLPVVTTIVRFHQSADFAELQRALYCLYAMVDCVVVPMIAAQDLSQQQQVQLQNLISEFDWKPGYAPVVCHHQSRNGYGDLRSPMLNESLKRATTEYVAFLDYDDRLFPDSYRWLIDRLTNTGKAVTFGRVYWSDYLSKFGRITNRKRLFETGYSYYDFYEHNYVPLHSFMLNVKKLDLTNLVHFQDQKYMEDYLLTLQLFTPDNADWSSLLDNRYIGDYIHSLDRPHTLALTDDVARDDLLLDPLYRICEERIETVKKNLKLKFT